MRYAQSLLFVLIFALAACTTLLPKTPEQTVQMVYLTVESVNLDTVRRVESDILTAKEAEAILEVTSGARRLADAATQALENDDASGAARNIALAITLLTALEERLE